MGGNSGGCCILKIVSIIVIDIRDFVIFHKLGHSLIIVPLTVPTIFRQSSTLFSFLELNPLSPIRQNMDQFLSKIFHLVNVLGREFMIPLKLKWPCFRRGFVVCSWNWNFSAISIYSFKYFLHLNFVPPVQVQVHRLEPFYRNPFHNTKSWSVKGTDNLT